MHVPRPPTITGLLPLFRESAHSLPMEKHDIDLISKATEHINPEQVPLITMDQQERSMVLACCLCCLTCCTTRRTSHRNGCSSSDGRLA